MHIFVIAVSTYLFSVAVVLAGMILTPTEQSRKLDAEVRARHTASTEWEINYLLAKVMVAAVWPVFFLFFLKGK